MEVVIIEDQDIIAHSILDDFELTSQKQLSIKILKSISDIADYDFTHTKYIVSDLFLGTSIYDTFVELHRIKAQHPSISISVFTQSTQVNMLVPLLSLIQADHLFDKSFDIAIANRVLNDPPQVFSASKSELSKVRSLIGMDSNTKSIFDLLAEHITVTTISLEKGKSKSAISQSLRKAELLVGGKQYLMKLFAKNV